MKHHVARTLARGALALAAIAGVTLNPALAAHTAGRVSLHVRPAINAPCLVGSVCINHVLLISVDGMHDVDLERYIRTHPASTLAALASNGTTYDRAYTPAPSDSFPGLLGLVTGGNPVTTGVYYDDSYDRTLFAPGSACKGAPGAEMIFDESIDYNLAALDGGGGIDPAKLPLARVNNECVAVYPHNFLRVNTIFEVARGRGGYTAWSDKHPAYDLVNGPSGKGVNDLFTPEIASVPLTEPATQAYDHIKVTAVVNELKGLSHDGQRIAPVPSILGMNFQALSVAQKDANGGYLDAAADPGAEVASALDFVDGQLALMLSTIAERGLIPSTAVIITAKHGQSPIDHKLRRLISKSALATAVPSAAQITADDGALLWFGQSSPQAIARGLAALQQNAGPLGILRLYSGATPPSGFGSSPYDPRAPDILVRSIPGVIYAGATATKIAEHGGAYVDDRHVALLVAYPGALTRHVADFVETTDVAPTILGFLGIDPNRLQSVRLEKTPLLPGIFEP